MGNLQTKPQPAAFTEKTLPDQIGKVFLITGATGGIGKELAQILFAANAKIWITARSRAKGLSTVEDIRTAHPTSKGRLELLILDFNDLATLKPAVEVFLRQESRLDVLWNNAGIMIPPKGQKTTQGYESQLGVNTIAPFLLTKLLTGILVHTANSAPQSSARVVWVSSSAAANFAPQGGVDMSKLVSNEYSQWQKYGMSKAGSILLAAEFARRYGGEGVLSTAVDPGNLDTGLYINMPKWQYVLASKLALKPPIYGAYTEMYAGLSMDVSSKNNGAWIVPWGALATPRDDIDRARKVESSGGSGQARAFWEWCDSEVASFL